MEPGTFSKPGVLGPGWGACERVSVGRGCGKKRQKDVNVKEKAGLVLRWVSIYLGGPDFPKMADPGALCFKVCSCL